jgi:hypothetical protein
MRAKTNRRYCGTILRQRQLSRSQERMPDVRDVSTPDPLPHYTRRQVVRERKREIHKPKCLAVFSPSIVFVSLQFPMVFFRELPSQRSGPTAYLPIKPRNNAHPFAQ